MTDIDNLYIIILMKGGTMSNVVNRDKRKIKQISFRPEVSPRNVTPAAIAVLSQPGVIIALLKDAKPLRPEEYGDIPES